ncbi:hypothetical protein K7432_000288 [Basidiobolus ranarum]|uniref:BAG domain-containing protein n=1 Tax=Basidiobolus ranarum TaxID=34480 RepID=A0ABR2WBH9_9FUNG
MTTATFIPFYTHSSPFELFPWYPTHKRKACQSLYPDISPLFDRNQPDEFYPSKRRAVHPTTYRQHTVDPQYYCGLSPDEYYTQSITDYSSESEQEQQFDSKDDLESEFSHPFVSEKTTSNPIPKPDSESDVKSPKSRHNKKSRRRNTPKIDSDKKENRKHKSTKTSKVAKRKQRTSSAKKRKLQAHRLNEAAKVIQRQWRLHNQRQRNEASKKISQFIISQMKIHEAQQILKSLRKLRAYKAEVDTIYEKQSPGVFGRSLVFATSTNEPPKVLPVKENQKYLGYEDALLKMLIRIDEVDSMGSDIIRSTRKALVNKTQSLLDQLDEYKREQYSRLLSRKN